jgi:hypothetical protein
MNGLKKMVIRNMELLVIDEVSMLRADLLDAMDYMMQPFEKRLFWWCAYCIFTAITTRTRDEEWRCNYYKGKFFFHSACRTTKSAIELSTIFSSNGYRAYFGT